MPVNQAIFLDRDGVIVENRLDYIRSWDDVEIYPESIHTLAGLSGKPYKIIIITNQSAVGQGLIPLKTAEDINQRLVQEIEQSGGRIDATYICPHTPQDMCSCRKPEAGLILRAADELKLDLKNSILIGDALSDIEAGRLAGIQKVALVRTGRGEQQERLVEASKLDPFPIYQDLQEAIENII